MSKENSLILIIITLVVLVLFGIKTDCAIWRNYISPESRVPILLYHHVLPRKQIPDPKNGGIVSLENFELQMDYLAANGYKTISLQELEQHLNNNIQLPPKTIAITFDDGYQSNYVYAYPVLKKHGFKATVFLITSLIERQPLQFDPQKTDYLSWPELQEMHDVFSFGSHSHSLHWELEELPAVFWLQPEEIKGDLIYSAQLLGAKYFSYPYGAYDERAKKLLKQSGYTMAFTVKQGPVKLGDDPLELKRMPVFNWTSLRQFAGILQRRK